MNNNAFTIKLLKRISTVLLIAAAAGILSALTLAPPAWASSPIFVRSGGDDLFCNGTANVDYASTVVPACAVKTVQRAMALVDPGGEVVLDTGTDLVTIPAANGISAAAATLVVDKTDSPDPAALQIPLTYTIRVSNTGDSPASDVRLIDTLPLIGVVSYKSVTSSQGICSPLAPDVISCTLGTILTNTNAVVTIVVTPTAAGNIFNNASVSAGGGPGDSDDELTAIEGATDLTISKTDFPDPVVVGTPLTYTLVVSNSGPAAAASATLTDTLPASVILGPLPSGCTPGAPTFTCTLGYLDVYSSTTLSFVVTPTVLGVITNTAGITVTPGATDPGPGDNLATQPTTVNAPVDLAITKSYSPTTLQPGDRLTFTLAITNLGNFTAGGVVVTETLPVSTTFAGPSGWTQVGASNQYTRSLSNLAAFSSTTTSFAIILPVGLPVGSYSFTNVVRVGHTGLFSPDTNLANNVYTLTFTMVVTQPPRPDLWVIKNDNVGPGALNMSMIRWLANSPDGLSTLQMFAAMGDVGAEAVPEGSLITYTIGYGNSSNGTAPATGVVLSETLPLYTSYAGPACGQPRGWCQVGAGRTYTYPVGGPLNPVSGDATEFIVRVANTVPATVTEILNTVCIYGNEGDLFPDNNCSNEQTQVMTGTYDLSVTKTESAVCLNPGDALNYTISVQNLGTNNAANVVLTETVPANTTAVNPPGSGWTLVSGGVYTYNLGIVASGAITTVPFWVQVDPVLGPSVTAITNTVSVGASGTDSNPANNSSTRVTPLGVTPDLVVTKNDNTSIQVNLGGYITYTIGYLNNSNRFTATNVVITDTLPPGTVITGNTAGWVLVGGSIYTRSIGNLGPNASGSTQLTVQIGSATPYPYGSEVINTVQIGGAQAECDVTNNSATEETPVSGVPASDLSVSKDDNVPVCAVPGDTIAYTIAYTNNSFSIDATNVTLTETIDPAAVSFLGPVGWSGGGSTFSRFITSTLAPRAGGVQTFNVQIAPTIPAGQEFITNVVRIGATADSNPANNIFTLITSVPAWPDLVVVKNDNVGSTGLSAMSGLDDLLARLHFSPEALALLENARNGEGQLGALAELVNPGDTITYTIILGNIGRVASTGTVLTENLPAGTTFVGPGYWHQVGSSSVYTYAVGTLNAGSGDVLQFIIRVNNPFNASSPIINTVQIDGAGDECNTTNNNSTDETPVSTSPSTPIYLPIIVKDPTPTPTPTPTSRPPTPTPTPTPLGFVSDVKTDPDTNQVFVASPRHDWVYVINGSSDTLARSVPVGHGPTGLAVLKGSSPANNKVFVAHQYGANFWRPGFMAFGVNETSAHTTFDAGYAGAAPIKTAANPVNSRVYVSNYFDKLAVYNGSLGAPEPRLGWVVQKGFQGAYGLDVSTATQRIYLATRDTGELVVFDGNSDRLLQDTYIPTHVKPPLACSLFSVAVNEATGHVFVPCPQLGRVFVLQESQISVLDLETLGELEERDGNLALVVSPQAAPWLDENGITVPIGTGEEGIAVNSSTGRVFITNARNNTLVVLQDGPTPSSVVTVNVGTRPQGVDVNPATQKVYVGNTGSNNVTVLNANPPFTITKTIPLAP